MPRLTNAQRRVYGTCPICFATQGKRCNLPDLRAAHIGRLQASATYSGDDTPKTNLNSLTHLALNIERQQRKDIGNGKTTEDTKGVYWDPIERRLRRHGSGRTPRRVPEALKQRRRDGLGA